MWEPGSDRRGPAADVLAGASLSPIRLGAKEGLAMINGTQMIAALGAEALERAARVARLADFVAALTLEVLFGTVRAFNPLIHDARPHPGQRQVAARVRAALNADDPSELFRSHGYAGKVQDACERSAYNLRHPLSPRKPSAPVCSPGVAVVCCTACRLASVCTPSPWHCSRHDRFLPADFGRRAECSHG